MCKYEFLFYVVNDIKTESHRNYKLCAKIQTLFANMPALFINTVEKNCSQFGYSNLNSSHPLVGTHMKCHFIYQTITILYYADLLSLEYCHHHASNFIKRFFLIFIDLFEIRLGPNVQVCTQLNIIFVRIWTHVDKLFTDRNCTWAQ